MKWFKKCMLNGNFLVLLMLVVLTFTMIGCNEEVAYDGVPISQLWEGVNSLQLDNDKYVQELRELIDTVDYSDDESYKMFEEMVSNLEGIESAVSSFNNRVNNYIEHGSELSKDYIAGRHGWLSYEGQLVDDTYIGYCEILGGDVVLDSRVVISLKKHLNVSIMDRINDGSKVYAIIDYSSTVDMERNNKQETWQSIDYVNFYNSPGEAHEAVISSIDKEQNELYDSLEYMISLIKSYEQLKVLSKNYANTTEQDKQLELLSDEDLQEKAELRIINIFDMNSISEVKVALGATNIAEDEDIQDTSLNTIDEIRFLINDDLTNIIGWSAGGMFEGSYDFVRKYADNVINYIIKEIYGLSTYEYPLFEEWIEDGPDTLKEQVEEVREIVFSQVDSYKSLEISISKIYSRNSTLFSYVDVHATTNKDVTVIMAYEIVLDIYEMDFSLISIQSLAYNDYESIMKDVERDYSNIQFLDSVMTGKNAYYDHVDLNNPDALNKAGMDYYNLGLYDEAASLFYKGTTLEGRSDDIGNIAMCNYNLACVISILRYSDRNYDNTDEFIQFLENSFVLRTDRIIRANEDSDLDNYRNETKFLQLMNKYGL